MVGIITLRYIVQITRIPITIRVTLIRGNKLDLLVMNLEQIFL